MTGLPLVCPSCGSDHMRLGGPGHRLPLCLSCRIATDSPGLRYADAERLAYQWEASGESEPGEGWSDVFESFYVVDLEA